MDMQQMADNREAIQCIQQAINHHDLDALAACFAPDYQSTFPLHPDRAFHGRDQMRRNWSQIFGAVPDIHATLIRCSVDGETVWAEWEWTGTLVTGAPFLHRGVTIHGVGSGLTQWVRLYMDPVREGEPGIESAETRGRR